MPGTAHVSLQDCVVDVERGLVRRHDGAVESLTTLETRVLAYFVRNTDRDLSRDELLEKVWGYAAGVDTRAAYFTIRRLRTKLETDPSHPRHILNVRGVGWRFVPLPASAAPTARPVPVETRRRTNLARADAEPFLGRKGDVASLEALLDTPGLVTLVGPAGTGKTRLAQEIGRRRVETSEVWFCDLTSARTSSDTEEAVAAVLGLDRGGQGQIGAALASRGRVLLILDNFEQLVAGAAATVGGWVQDATEASVLVTSRERLRVRGERVSRLGPLDLEHAVGLIRHRAAAVGRSLPADAATQETLRAVAASLDGLPLALELAAARLRVLSPDGLLARLDDRFRLLARSDRDATDRHATLRAALDWSWRLLDPHERAALAACSLFRGGFWLEDAEAVIRLDDPAAPPVLDLVQSLCDKSLLVASEDGAVPGELRLTMLQSVAQFAAQHLDDAELAERHARWFTERGEALSRRVPRGDAHAIAQLQADVPNLLAAMERTADPTVALRAALALDRVQVHREALAPRRDRLRRVLRRARDAPHPMQVTGWLALARMSPAEDGLRDVARARELAGPDPAGPLACRIAITEGQLLLYRGHLAQAEACFVQAAALADRASDLVDEALQGHLAVFIHRGDVLRAGPVVERLLAGRAPDDPRPFDNLAVYYTRIGDRERQERALRHDLAIHEALGQNAFAARDRLNLGSLWASIGRPGAQEILSQAVEAFQTLGDQRLETVACTLLSGLAYERGDAEACRRWAQAAIALGEETAIPQHVAVGLQSLAWVEVLRDGDATELAHRALKAAQDGGDVMLVQLCWLLCALAAARRGHDTEVQGFVARALASEGPTTDEQQVLVQLYLAMIELASGRDAAVAAALERAEPWLSRSIGVRLTRRAVLDCRRWVSSS